MIDTTPRPAPAEAATALLRLARGNNKGFAVGLGDIATIAPCLPATVRRLVRNDLLQMLRSTLFRDEPAVRAAQCIATSLTDTQDPDLADIRAMGCEYDAVFLAIIALTDGRGMQWRQLYQMIRSQG